MTTERLTRTKRQDICDLVQSLLWGLPNGEIELCEGWLTSLSVHLHRLDRPKLYAIFDREQLGVALLHSLEYKNPEFQILGFYLLAMTIPNDLRIGDALVAYLEYEGTANHSERDIATVQILAAAAMANQSDEHANLGMTRLFELGLAIPPENPADTEITAYAGKWLRRNFPATFRSAEQTVRAAIAETANPLSALADRRLTLLLTGIEEPLETPVALSRPSHRQRERRQSGYAASRHSRGCGRHRS